MSDIKPSTLTATWSIDTDADALFIEKKIDISMLSRDEQADLIIERLKMTQAERDRALARKLEEEFAILISKHIADEIDAVILPSLGHYGKQQR